MLRNAAGWVFCALSVLAPTSGLAADPPTAEVPALTGPVLEGPAEAAVTKPPAPTPAPTPAVLPAPSSVLVVPGMAGPKPSARTSTPAATPAHTPNNPPGVTLSGPVGTDLELPPPSTGLDETVTTPAGRKPRAGAEPGRPSALPLTLESIPDGESDTAAAPKGEAANATRPKLSPSLTPPPSSRRGIGLFGRRLPFGNDRGAADRDAIHVEPRTDPAADAALKRRLERQIRESVGSRVKTCDVRVVGRDVSIRAQGVRFWQRRGVKSTLEALPALNGYIAKVEILD